MIGAVMSQQVADCSITSNSFLAWANGIDSSLVKTTAVTTGPFPVCNELWSTSGKVGTCCDTDKFKALFEKKIGESKNRWGSYMSTLHKMRNNLNKIAKLTGTDIDASLDSMRSDSKFDLMQLTNAQIKQILTAASNFGNRLNEFKTEGKTCFREMANLRSKVFCHGCWAFGSSLFTASSATTIPPSFKMSPKSCHGLVTKCGTAWKFIHDSILTMNLMAQVASKKNNLGKDKAPVNDKNIFNKASLSVATVQTSLDKCLLTSWVVSNDCTDTDIQNICGAYFSWAGSEKVAKQINDEPAQATVAARLLQSASTDDSATVFDAAGGDLTATITGPTANSDLDTTTAGDFPNSARLVAVLGSLMALLLVILN